MLPCIQIWFLVALRQYRQGWSGNNFDVMSTASLENSKKFKYFLENRSYLGKSFFSISEWLLYSSWSHLKS